ncbi:Putative peptidoglycan binding domain-containing protein [Amycolatopsis xylanica]|uniref:Putative peptidoglycan binding domain-containing protein n=1 Tax=Amycolatopsis xylanica TaxID=589385 RepID=A0A1H2YDG1_9PSEU|nr:peptidoglycan-binding protein [Amycolatopsis xylanica]SDX03243.1 Putative peptidoglycan binding domain-containing protein [Amycolatopsis xylanica]
MSEHEGPSAVRKGRRARWLITAAIAIVLLGTGSVVVLTRVSAGASTGDQAPAPGASTTDIVKTTLTEEETADATLGYGSETSVSGRKEGTITSLPQVGAKIDRGKKVYDVNAKPVPLFYGTLPFYRDLSDGVDKGPDVKQLEENLKALGFGGFGAPDEKFTSATAAALKKWQKSLGLEQTGTFGQGDVVLAAGPIRVSAVSAQPGSPAGSEILKFTGTDRVVTAKLDAKKQSLAQQGGKVGLEISGKQGTGTVDKIGTSVDKDQNDPNAKPKIEVSIKLDDQATAGSLDSAPVTVHFTKGKRENVLAVPVGALLALAEGGFAVEVDEGGKRRLVAVQTGLFSGGKVEITGDGLKAGMKVVTTS